MVQDPNFWRRFSVAVHNDEAAMLAAEAGTKKETKHAYVVSLSSPIDSSASTPTSQCHLSPAFPPAAFTRPLSAPAHVSAPEKAARREARKSKATSGTRSVYFEAFDSIPPEMIALHKLSSHNPSHAHTTAPSLPSTPRSTHFALGTDSPLSQRASRRASRFRFALSSHPPSLPPTPKSCTFPSTNTSPGAKRGSRFSRHVNASRLSLGVSLSGRPKSAFRFWTTVTAGDEADAETNAGIRDSWLEGQQRKARQRAWMCWAFWGVFLVVVVGTIVAVLVLKGKGII